MDSDFEIFSLKDSVWKLNTRVLVLESFITQQFGPNVLRDVVKNDPVSTSSSKSTPGISSTTSRAQNSSAEKKIQPQEARTSKKRTKRVNSEERSEEESTDNGNDKNDKSNRLRRIRISTKKVKYNTEEDSSTEYYINNEDSDPQFIALLEPKSEVTDEVQNDTDTEMTEAEIQNCQNTTDISNKPNESALNKNEKTDHGPTSFTLTKSRRGKDLLVDSNQKTYRFHKFGANNKLLWMCIRNDDLNCKGRVHTIGNELVHVVPHSTIHIDNIRDLNIGEVKLKRKRKKGAAVTLNPPPEIVATALQSEDYIAVEAQL